MICEVKIEQQFVPFKIEKDNTSFEYNKQANIEFVASKQPTQFNVEKQNIQFGYRIVCSHGALVGDGSCLSDFVIRQNFE